MNIEVTPNRAGTKEEIKVNGSVFLKAAPAGKWQYIVEITLLEDGVKHEPI